MQAAVAEVFVVFRYLMWGISRKYTVKLSNSMTLYLLCVIFSYSTESSVLRNTCADGIQVRNDEFNSVDTLNEKKNDSQAARAVSKSCNCGAKGPSFEPRTLLSSIKILEQKRALNGLEETSPEDCDETLAWCEEIIRMAFLSIMYNFRKTKSSSSSIYAGKIR